MSFDPSPLFYFLNERQRIRDKRYSGEPFPWTEDPILRTYSFCEVFRQDDRVSRWIIDNWLKPYDGHPNMWLACCIARQINWPDTLEAIGFPEDEDYPRYAARSVEIMNGIAGKGDKVYTGAYVIYGGPGKAGGYPTKPNWTMNGVILPAWEQRRKIQKYFDETPTWERSIEYVVKWLELFPGFSGFMGYEAACDMSYTSLLKDAQDIFTWANPGPGAMRGLNRLHGRKLDWKIPEQQAVGEMKDLLAIANSPDSPLGEHVFNRAQHHTGSSWLVLRDIESGLCETDKYLRVKNGEGKPRSKFVQPEKRK